jgi:ABC-type oligopeptide transport system substrate-binding subunit
LRRAVSRAIDRERLRQLLYGAVEPAQSLVPPGIPGSVRDDSVVDAHRFVPLEAFRAWQRVRAGDPRPLRLTAPTECSPNEEAILQDVAMQLTSNLGVPVELVRLAAREWERAVEEGTFQLLWWRWPLPFPDAAAVYEWLLSSERRTLRGLRWRSDALDRLLVLARGETALTRRLGAYRQCERLAHEEFVLLPICHPVATYLVQPWVVTLPRTPTGELLDPERSFSRFLSAVTLSSRSS